MGSFHFDPLADKGETFVMFGPEATTTDSYRQGLVWLEHKGFNIRSWVWLELNHIIAEKLYPSQFAKGGTPIDLAIARSTADRFLLVLLEAKSLGDASRLLCNWKGNSDPSHREADTLRSYLAAESRILSFIHSPDNFDKSNEEIKILSEGKVCKRGNSRDELISGQNYAIFNQESVRLNDKIARLYGDWEERWCDWLEAQPCRPKDGYRINSDPVKELRTISSMKRKKPSLDDINRVLFSSSIKNHSREWMWYYLTIGSFHYFHKI